MSSPDPVSPRVRKPREQLRRWSTYATVGEWFTDYAGYVPIQIPAAISRLIRNTGMSFPDAYRTLLKRGAIIHLDPADDAEAPAGEQGTA